MDSAPILFGELSFYVILYDFFRERNYTTTISLLKTCRHLTISTKEFQKTSLKQCFALPLFLGFHYHLDLLSYPGNKEKTA